MKIAGFAKKCYHKVLEKGKQHRILHREVITQEATVIHQEQHETTENDK